MRPETRSEAVARILMASKLHQPVAGMTEAELAAKLIADRAKMKAMDERFLGPGDELMVSQALAQRMGWNVGGDDGEAQ